MERLIFCLKENYSLDHLFSFDKMALKINRLHGIEDEMSLRFGINDFTIIRNEKLFNSTVYNSLDETKRRLYRTYLVELPNIESLNKVYSDLKESDFVEYVQLDGTNSLFYNPKDPLYTGGYLWGLKTINCEKAWDISKGENIVVAVVDTGINYNHPDIVSNLWNDRNGNIGIYVSTDPKDKSKIVYSQCKSDILDSGWHGSHLSGSIAATMDTDDIVGVAPLSKIMTIRVSENDNTIKDAIGAEGIRKAVYEGANVINISWGRLENNNKNICVENAIDFAIKQGVVVVCAAGNQNFDVSQITPANYSKVICVGATSQNDERWISSNFGDKVTITAPGENIYSIDTSLGTSPESGTSMAAAYVSGVVALMLAVKPLCPSEIKSIIETNGFDLIMRGKGDWKRINAEKCVNAVNKFAQSNSKLTQNSPILQPVRDKIDEILKEHRHFLISILEGDSNTNPKLALVGLGIAKVNQAITLNQNNGDIAKIISLAILSHGYIPISNRGNEIERYVLDGSFGGVITAQFIPYQIRNFMPKIAEPLGGEEMFFKFMSRKDYAIAYHQALYLASIFSLNEITEDIESATITFGR